MTKQTACCYFGYVHDWCDAVTEDAVADGWFMALDSSHPNADAYYVCPDHKNTMPLCAPVPCVEFEE